MVPCICIDDTNKPMPIPAKDWVKLDEAYHITLITVHPNQGFIQGCALYEKPLINCEPFEFFKLNRFAVKMEDFQMLVDLIKESADINDVDVAKLLEESGIHIKNQKLETA